MFRRIVLLGFLLAGCRGLPSPEEIARGVQIVDQTYDVQDIDAPLVHAVDTPTCTDPFGNGGLVLFNGCVPGWTADDGCTILLGPVLSDTQLAHEMHHWAIYVRRGKGDASMDPDHLDPTWGWEVELANEHLRGDGL